MQRMTKILLPLVVLLISSSAAGAAPATDDSIPLVVLATADFDGDGRQDKLLGAVGSPAGGYRSLLVKSAKGETLLDITDGRYYYIAEVADLRAPNPVLITGTAYGNKWAELEAWTFLPRQGFQHLRWGTKWSLVGRILSLNPAERSIHVNTEAGKLTFRYLDGALVSN